VKLRNFRGGFPPELTDAVAVLLEFGESVEVVEQTLYDGFG